MHHTGKHAENTLNTLKLRDRKDIMGKTKITDYLCVYCRIMYFKERPTICPECGKSVFKAIKRKS